MVGVRPGMYERILLATDGSDHTRRAAEYVRTLSDRFDAEVHVLAVADVGSVSVAFDTGGVEQEVIERLKRQSEEWAAETGEFVDAAETAVVSGKPREEILDYASGHGVDLLAMGTHGRTGIRRYVIGSVTEHVLRRAEAPVLTARADEEANGGDISRVLVPTDGSDAAGAAVDHAVAVADACGAAVRVLSVVDTRALAAQSELAPSDVVIESLEERSEHAISEVAERCEAAGLSVETAVARGPPSQAICEDAEESGADLVVMGTRGRSGLDRVLLGSVTERTVRHAPVPVMAVGGGEPGGE
jgi:nucleotide-binding universal stress UspA family protein